MPAQQRDVRKNYIGIVSDKIEEQRADDWLIKSSQRVRDFFLGMRAVVLKRKARPEG